MADELVNLTEFSAILGISRQYMSRLYHMTTKPGPPFPAPAYAGRELLWSRSDVLAYKEARREYAERKRIAASVK